MISLREVVPCWSLERMRTLKVLLEVCAAPPGGRSNLFALRLEQIGPAPCAVCVKFESFKVIW